MRCYPTTDPLDLATNLLSAGELSIGWVMPLWTWRRPA